MSETLESRSEKHKTRTVPSSGKHKAQDNGRMIELHKLYKLYKTTSGDFPALKGIDLNIEQGEFVAVIGKSGAGKSTLVNMITGIDFPTSGEIIVDGFPVHDQSEDQKARWRGLNLGVVFQFFQLLPTLNLIENITITMDFCSTYPPKERKARALHLLDQVGIVEHAYKTPSKISGGQQQRVAIARAMANDPGIIVADEPTGNLDSRTAGEIFELFSSFVDQGKTLLVVSHNKDIGPLATRVIKIADGEILNGDHKMESALEA